MAPKISGPKSVRTYVPTNSISDGPITNLHSVLRILMELIEILFMCSCQGEGKGVNGIEFGTFIGRFSE